SGTKSIPKNLKEVSGNNWTTVEITSMFLGARPQAVNASEPCLAALGASEIVTNLLNAWAMARKCLQKLRPRSEFLARRVERRSAAVRPLGKSSIATRIKTS